MICCMAGLNVSSGKLQMDTLNSCGMDDNETEKYILLSGRQVFNQKERKMSIECQLEENRKTAHVLRRIVQEMVPVVNV